MDVNQLRVEANALSDEIEAKIKAFESLTGTTVSEIRLNRIDASTIEAHQQILNVDVRVEL